MVNLIHSKKAQDLAAHCEWAETPRLLIGGLTAASLIGYTAAYAMGHYRHLARRVTRYSMLGLTLGVVGWNLRKINSQTEVGLGRIVLGASYSPKPLREIASDIQALQAVNDTRKIEALKKLISGTQSLIIADRNTPFGVDSKVTLGTLNPQLQKNNPVFIKLDRQALFGENNPTSVSELIPPLLQEALIESFKEVGQNYTFVSVGFSKKCTLTQLLPLIRKFKEIPNLHVIDFCQNATTFEECEVLSKLLDDCPKLITIPAIRLGHHDTNKLFPTGIPQHITDLHNKCLQIEAQRKP